MTPALTEKQQKQFDAVCDRIAFGESLNSICRDETMPDKSTVIRWLMKGDPAVCNQYARAREMQAEIHADELIDIADDGHNDWMARKGEDDAGWQANGEHIQRSKLRIDTRKWTASKLRPKVYGDRIHQELTGKDGERLIPEISEEEVARRAAFLLAKGLKRE